jgi:hypothetical protein
MVIMGQEKWVATVFKGYFSLPPPVPVAPCVDSSIAYDDFAKAIERIHDVFLVCFCTSHRNSPFLPQRAVHGLQLLYIIQRTAL